MLSADNLSITCATEGLVVTMFPGRSSPFLFASMFPTNIYKSRINALSTKVLIFSKNFPIREFSYQILFAQCDLPRPDDQLIFRPSTLNPKRPNI